MIRNMLDKKMAEVNQEKTTPLAQMKIEHFMRSIKEEFLDDDDKSATQKEEINYRNQGISSKNQEKLKESIESFHKSEELIKIYLKHMNRVCVFE